VQITCRESDIHKSGGLIEGIGVICLDSCPYLIKAGTNSRCADESGSSLCDPGGENCRLAGFIEDAKKAINEFKEKPSFAGYGSYQEYLQSDHWKELSVKAKQWAGNRCQLCNKDGELHTHHRTYGRLGQELAGDLIVLCANCHAKFHDKETTNDR